MYILNDKNLPVWKATRWAVLKYLGVLKGFGKVENIKILNKNYSSSIAFHDSNQIVFDGPAISKSIQNRTVLSHFKPSAALPLTVAFLI